MSKDNNGKPNYGHIITTIGVALFVLCFTLISSQLNSLDMRIRALEIKVAEIAVRLGIDQAGQQKLSTGPQAPAPAVYMAPGRVLNTWTDTRPPPGSQGQ